MDSNIMQDQVVQENIDDDMDEEVRTKGQGIWIIDKFHTAPKLW